MKTVQFDPAVRFLLVVPSNGMAAVSNTTPSLTRYTEHDYKRIRRGIKKTIKAVRSLQSQNPTATLEDFETLCEDDSLRGLEHLRTPECLEQQIINKDCAIESVLMAREEALDDQLHGQLHDDQQAQARRAEDVAASYARHNLWAQRNAHEIAQRDEAFVNVHVRPNLQKEMEEVRRIHELRLAEEEMMHKAQDTLASALEESLVLHRHRHRDSSSSSSSLSSSSSCGSSDDHHHHHNRNCRPHAPSRIQPPSNWLQHRDSLQLTMQHSLDADDKHNNHKHASRAMARSGTSSTITGTTTINKTSNDTP